MGRRASCSSRCAVHQGLVTIERSLISRTGARRSRERCSSFEIDGPRDELKRIAYFHLLKVFTSPRSHASVSVGKGRNRNCTEVDLPTSIRGRSPPFLFEADPHGSAARSIAMPGRDRPPMTQDAVLPPSHQPRWQHVEEADHGRYALTHNCCLHGTAFPLTAVALLNGRQCCRCATPRDCCAGWCVTCGRRQHDVNGRRRRPGRATNLHDSDDAAAAGRRDIDVKLLDAQVLPSRYTPCIVWNTVYL